MMLFDNFSIDKETLRKDFYSPENEPQRRWFFQHYKGTNRKQIQDKFYEYNAHIHIYTCLAKEPIQKTTEEHIPQSPEVPRLIMEDT